MATIAVLPSREKAGNKPTRSMTHPLRDPNGHGTKRRVKKGEPFDPEELSRRLASHLADQKVKTERRRAAKAAAAQNSVYHHVPKVAAASFERTTTPDTMRQIHKLSQPALKQHLEVLSLDDSNNHLTNLQRKQALDHAIIEREQLRNRNQFQWNRDMEKAAEADVDRNVNKPLQRSFNSDLVHLKSRNDNRAQRPMSTGDVLSEEEEIPTAKARPKTKPTFDGRNDWAQQDQQKDEGVRDVKEKPNPFLRKKDSIWIMKSKRENHGKQDKDGVVVGVSDSGLSPDEPRSGKASFLARFKRHPS